MAVLSVHKTNHRIQGLPQNTGDGESHTLDNAVVAATSPADQSTRNDNKKIDGEEKKAKQAGGPSDSSNNGTSLLSSTATTVVRAESAVPTPRKQTDDALSSHRPLDHQVSTSSWQAGSPAGTQLLRKR